MYAVACARLHTLLAATADSRSLDFARDDKL
jgi:hypothetical protein